MKKFLKILMDKRVQYLLIMWILLVKTIDIGTRLFSNIEFLSFVAMLGFHYLPAISRSVWDGIVICTVMWLMYRLLKDMFKVSFTFQQLSAKKLLGLMLLLIWLVSVTTVVLQIASLLTFPLADPKLEVSRHYAPSPYLWNQNSCVFDVDNIETKEVKVDLSKSFFADPFSFCSVGEISESGTKYVGASYFSIKNNFNGQRMIEMRFSGNGSNGKHGWFANKILLKEAMPISENATLIILLRLSPSCDGTAWTYIKIDFLSEKNEICSLTWKFHDIPMNYIFSNNDGIRSSYYLLGSVTDWAFYQFDLPKLFYMSFSLYPQHIIAVEYGIGAEDDNDVKAQFLLAKISSQPLEINEMRIEDVKPHIKLNSSNSISVKGLDITMLYITLMPNITKKVINTQWYMQKISRTESYWWDARSLNAEEVKLYFKVLSNFTKFFLDGKEIAIQSQDQLGVYELNHDLNEIKLIVVNETNVYLMPLATLTTIFIIFYLIIKSFKHVLCARMCKDATRT